MTFAIAFHAHEATSRKNALAAGVRLMRGEAWWVCLPQWKSTIPRLFTQTIDSSREQCQIDASALIEALRWLIQ
jgi:hypothetical protein